jgi:hypothetical protein
MIYAAILNKLETSKASFQGACFSHSPPLSPPTRSEAMSRLSCTLSYSSNRGVKTEVTKCYTIDQLQDILDSPQLANDTDVQKWGETVKRMSPESTYRTSIVQNSSSLQRSKKTTTDTKAASRKKRKTHHNQWEKQPRMNGRFTKGKGKEPVQQNKHASPPQGTST